MKIKVKNILNKDHISQVLFDEEIYKRISCDDICPSLEESKKNFDYHNYKWFVGYADNKPVSLFWLFSDGHFDFMVLKPYRKYARVLLEKSLKFITQWGLPKLHSVIPVNYKSVINFATKNNFYIKDYIKDCYTMNGIKVDGVIIKHILG